MTTSAASASSTARPPKRRRRFSLNALAIQLSAFALSFTLVALLVVTGSEAAFVEPSEALAEYVASGAAATDEPDRPRRSPSAPPAPPPAPVETPLPDVPATESSPTPSPTAVGSATPVRAVELSDSDAGTAMFGADAVLSPGVRLERCIEVTWSGSSSGAPVQLYAPRTAGDLAPHLDLTVEMGSGAAGSFGGCSGFTPDTALYSGTLAAFAGSHPSYATGLGTWTPSAEQKKRVFRFGLSVRDTPAASGLSVSFGFTWESRDD